MKYYKRTLFQKAKIEREVMDNSNYDAKNHLALIAENVPVGLVGLSKNRIQEIKGSEKVTTFYLLHTLFPDIQTGDVITVDGYGVFKAADPCPAYDRKGIHHYEIVIERIDQK